MQQNKKNTGTRRKHPSRVIGSQQVRWVNRVRVMTFKIESLKHPAAGSGRKISCCLPLLAAAGALVQQLLRRLKQQSLGAQLLRVHKHRDFHPFHGFPNNVHADLILLASRFHPEEGHDDFRRLRPCVADFRRKPMWSATFPIKTPPTLSILNPTSLKFQARNSSKSLTWGQGLS